MRLFYVANYRNDKVDCSAVYFDDPFLLYDFAPGVVHLLPQEVVSSGKHAPKHRLQERLLGLVPVCYRERSSLTLDKAVQLV